MAATHGGDTWRLTLWLALIFFLSQNFPVAGQSKPSKGSDLEAGLQRVSEIVQRADLDAHSQTWQQIETLKDADGNNVFRTNLAFIQVETGMHYREKEQWKQTQELIEPFAGGAVASHGPHKVIFAENLNTAGAIDMETPDAKRLRSHVLGLAYVDTTSGKSVFIAEIKDCRGEIVNSNQVIYSDAFKGVKADVRYTYTKSGFEQDIILRSQPPSPKDFGFDPETVRLQIYTEFLDPPKPDTQTVKFQDSRGEDATDELLDFGDMKIGVGRAFSLGEETKAGMPVAKKWVNEGGRSFLVEELAFTDASAELEALPKGASISRPNKSSRMAKWDRRLPRTPKAASTRGKMLMAKFDSNKPGLVMDYVMLNGNLQNYTFKGDTTYYISGNVILLNTTTIEGGTVVKYAPGKYIQLSSSVVCKTGPYRPAIFTARDDDTVGEILTGISTGTPSGYYASTALSAPSSSSPVLSYLRISYATQGLYYNYIYGSSPTVSNVQFVNCQVGIATYNCPGVKVRNGLFKNVITAFSMYSGYSSGIPDAQHITVDGCTWLWATSHPYGQGIFKNCIFANVSGLINQSGGASVGGANNGFFNAPSFGSSPITFTSPDPSPFQTVGAGTCYLDASSSSGSAFINAGNAPIDAALAAQLKLKTTTAPQSVFDNQTIGTGTTWSQTVTRDTDTPDLGYHYEPLDVCVSRATLGGTLTVSSGTAVGYFGLYGFRNGTLSIQGTPLNRNKLVHYSAVQEQPVSATPWGANAASCYLLKSGEMPNVVTRFTDISTAGGPSFSGGWVNGLNLAHSTLYGARLSHDTGGPNSHVFTNNIIERCSFSYGLCGGPGYGVKFVNNLFLNSSLTAGYFCYPGFASSVTVQNNLFAGSTFTWSGWNAPQNSYNGYFNSTVTSQGTSPMTVSTLDFQTGALGPYYYPATGGNLFSLVNAGSTTSASAGLYHFTTQTTQAKEASSQVDIGFHYVVVNSSGNPIDSDSDGLADYFEDINGNGQTDAGETPWITEVSIVTTDPNCYEDGHDTGIITITRTTDNLTVPLTVLIQMSGTANEGIDYFPVGTQVTIQPNDISADVFICPYTDFFTAEGNESVTVTLQNSSNYRITGASSASLIINDGAAPADQVVSVELASATACENTGQAGSFTIWRSGGNLSGPLSVTFQLTGSAVEGVDYQSMSPHQLTIPANANFAAVAISPVSDGSPEGTETVVLTLLPVSNYTLGSPVNATVNITDSCGGEAAYAYPLTPGSPAWINVRPEERVKSVIIPQSWRSSANSWQLFLSATANPYFTTICYGKSITESYNNCLVSQELSILNDVESATDFGVNALRYLGDLSLSSISSTLCSQSTDPCWMHHVIVSHMAGRDKALNTMNQPDRQRLFRLAVWDANYFISNSDSFPASAAVRLIYVIYEKPVVFRGAFPPGVTLPTLSQEQLTLLTMNIVPADLIPAIASVKTALGLTSRP